MEQSVCKVCICYVFSIHERRSNFIYRSHVCTALGLSVSVCVFVGGRARCPEKLGLLTLFLVFIVSGVVACFLLPCCYCCLGTSRQKRLQERWVT